MTTESTNGKVGRRSTHQLIREAWAFSNAKFLAFIVPFMTEQGHAIQFVAGNAPVATPAVQTAETVTTPAVQTASVPQGIVAIEAETVAPVTTTPTPNGIVAIAPEPEVKAETFALEAFREIFVAHIDFHASNTFARKDGTRYAPSFFKPVLTWALRGEFDEYHAYLTDPKHPLKVAKGAAWVGSVNSAKGKMMANLKAAYVKYSA